MKRVCICLVFILLATFSRAIEASVNTCVFNASNTSYAEVYLHIVGNSVVFVPVDSTYHQAAVNILILFKQGDRIVNYDKYQLTSPLSRRPINFIDLKRFGLADGKYDLEITIHDVNDSTSVFTYDTPIEVSFPSENVSMSDLELLGNFYQAEGENLFIRNGYYMEPLPFNFYNRFTSTLAFYTEIYNSDVVLGEDFYVRYYVRTAGSIEDEDIYIVGNKRKKPYSVNVLLLQMDIRTLPSGNYDLVVEVRDRSKNLLCKKITYFQRSNPYLNLDEVPVDQNDLASSFVQELDTSDLEYSLRAIAMNVPYADAETVNVLIRDGNIKAQRSFLYNYWLRRDPNDPASKYQEYMAVASKIDEVFQSGFGYGFETDRGDIYMRYGVPDDIVQEENDPTAPPYEIWIYYDFPQTRQSNVKFLFYNPSLATNDYILLHSNAIGEIQNPQWQLELYRNAPTEFEGDNRVDATRMQDGYNRNAARYFNDY